MERVDQETPPPVTFYLPHHEIYKPEKSSTKLRILFNASAPTTTGLSLNDILLSGEVKKDIFHLIVRFRRQGKRPSGPITRDEFTYAKLAVVRLVQRIVFKEEIQALRYGATIAYHLDNVETARKLKESFYVDNSETSFNSFEEVEKFMNLAKLIMSDAKFELRDWQYNTLEKNDDPGLFSETQTYLKASENTTNCISVLGIVWDVKEDTLSCNTKTFPAQEVPLVTKRKILSLAQAIFDPIGFSCALTLLPKLLLQECCRLKLSWDQEVPKKI
ncbi:uncharacterized protein LOC118204054 [Stegodyphus dumicola]|uniref:uncharacterized protein LOC118204054 n=1 Tax=Stegodyphus dumicola TaxID=202533 RepID=UPI0015A7D707|nr:uncharacterized protein LOC118204054 [Stegodyphus dumicola]